MKEVKKTISLDPGDSIEIDKVTLITNCGGIYPEEFLIDISEFCEDHDEEENHDYSIKFKRNNILVQIWAKQYEIISREKMKEILEELSK